MTVSWNGYTPFDPGVEQPLHQVSKREARAAFKLLMAAKAGRIEELRELLQINGVVLSSDDDGLQRINDWFCAEVEGNAETLRLEGIWYSVVNDLALFLGDVLIERCPGLHWVMFDKGARDVSYQRHVIMGFTKVPNPKFNFDVDLMLAAYGHQIISAQEVQANTFVTWISEQAAYA
ncbi:hypothetical protein OG474_29430 [Kribbella sp. NBC_01505]|uniref:hypothetical protein n=1 Tax=Kribbella sp. NBC_01505 TaxID=2903580 RepID=UPI0038693EC8